MFLPSVPVSVFRESSNVPNLFCTHLQMAKGSIHYKTFCTLAPPPPRILRGGGTEPVTFQFLGSAVRSDSLR